MFTVLYNWGGRSETKFFNSHFRPCCVGGKTVKKKHNRTTIKNETTTEKQPPEWVFLETTKFLHPTQFLQQQNEDERRLTKHMDNFPMKRTLFSKGKSCTGESLKNNHKADLSLRMNLTHKKHKKSTSRWENFKGSHVLVVD